MHSQSVREIKSALGTHPKPQQRNILTLVRKGEGNEEPAGEMHRMAAYKLSVGNGSAWERLGLLVWSILELLYQCHGPTNTMEMSVAGLPSTTSFITVDTTWVTSVSSDFFCHLSLFNCVVPSCTSTS